MSTFMCNDTYPYGLASAVSKTRLCLFTIWYWMGCQASFSARPDQTHSGLGFDPCQPTRFASPDQNLYASPGQGCKTKTQDRQSLGQECIETDSMLRPGRPFLDRGKGNDTYPFRLASTISKTELCLFTLCLSLNHPK